MYADIFGLFQFTWYARRIALGSVYKATELYLLQDNSEDHKQTWEFLARRLEELFQIHSLLHQSENIGNVAGDTITSAFTTVSSSSSNFRT